MAQLTSLEFNFLEGIRHIPTSDMVWFWCKIIKIYVIHWDYLFIRFGRWANPSTTRFNACLYWMFSWKRLLYSFGPGIWCWPLLHWQILLHGFTAFWAAHRRSISFSIIWRWVARIYLKKWQFCSQNVFIKNTLMNLFLYFAEIQQCVSRFIKKYLRTDGLFILRLISQHADVVFSTELIYRMWKGHYQIEKQRE